MPKIITIGKKRIGGDEPAFIVAEAGVNHNGNVELAKKLIVAAKNAGADCVKFQTFTAESVVTKSAPKAKYQLEVTDPDESQFSMLKKLELPPTAYPALMKICEELDILFLSTPYNFSDVDLLELHGVRAYKLASIHCTELPMIEYVAQKKKPVFLSTGLSTLEDVVHAAQLFSRAGNDELVIMQCTTDYPAKPEDANLRAMQTIEKETHTVVGYSDNSDRIDTCIYAVAAGAKVIEKHFTLDKSLPGPDQAASANPEEFADMVSKIRQAEMMLGGAEKTITQFEARNAIGMKRSIVAVRRIAAGEVITAADLTFKRPAIGLPPNEWYRIIGKRAWLDIDEDVPVTKDMIDW